MCQACGSTDLIHKAQPSRRRFLASAGAVAAAISLASPAVAAEVKTPPPKPQNALPPDAALDRLVKHQVLARMDHKNLNQDLPEFSSAPPTTENLASVIQAALREHWNLPGRLAHLRISETDRNTFDLEATCP